MVRFSIRPFLSRTASLFAVAAIFAATQPATAQEENKEATHQLGVVSDQYPYFSPDGRFVTFESNRAGPVDQIFVLEIETGVVTQLTNSPEQNETPIWSPDGSKILFARRIADEPRTTWDVFEMNADGTDVRNITNSPGHDDHPRYSEDGNKIVFNSARTTDFTTLTEHQLDNGGYNYEIYVADADGSNPQRLTDFHEWDTYPSLSPDGEQLLWRRVHPDGGSGESGLNSEIYLSNIDGSNIENLTNNPAFDGYPVWSPDGKWIAFASNRDGEKSREFALYLLNPKDKSVIRLTDIIPDTLQARPAWSSDSKKIVFNRDYTDGRAEIHILELDDEVLNRK